MDRPACTAQVKAVSLFCAATYNMDVSVVVR